LDAPSMHLTLIHYRFNAARLDTNSKPGRNEPASSGFSGRSVFFVPEGALSRVTNSQSASIDQSRTPELDIDYGGLDELPNTTSADSTIHGGKPSGAEPGDNGQLTPFSQELQAVKDLLIKRDL